MSNKSRRDGEYSEKVSRNKNHSPFIPQFPIKTDRNRSASVISTSKLVYLSRLSEVDTSRPKPLKLSNPTLHVNKTCHVCLINIHSFVLRTQHFHWSNRHICLGNCLVCKINVHEKTFTLHGWTQMVVWKQGAESKLKNVGIPETVELQIFFWCHRDYFTYVFYNFGK